jgi:ABC-2 type transport system permease protein
VLAVLISLLTAGIGIAFGLPLPVNALLFLVAVVAGIVMIAALALWTAAWTRNAEAAQLTSGPVLLLMILGQTAIAYPDTVREVFTWTPGTAIVSLVRTGWFGLEPVTGGDFSQVPTLDFASSWAQAGQPLLVLGVWTVAALWLAARSMRWEPRT